MIDAQTDNRILRRSQWRSLVIIATIYAVGHLSGAHLNPAVSVAFALTRHFPWSRVALYVPAQVAGAIAAALISGIARRHG